MRVLVCGGRDFRSPAWIWTNLDRLNAERPFSAFIQGGAEGADRIAKEWAATKQGIVRFEYKAEWEKHGRAAGPIRNSRMLEWKPDLVVAFPTEKSVGTWDMINKAKAAGIEVLVF